MAKSRSDSAGGRSAGLRKRTALTTGAVFERYSEKVSGLRVDMIDEDIILIEGDASVFRFLGELFKTMAEDMSDCGTQFYPDGPGDSFFSESSKFGLYLHRLPCLNPPVIADDESPIE
jgi:hypothetical protein